MQTKTPTNTTKKNADPAPWIKLGRFKPRRGPNGWATAVVYRPEGTQAIVTLSTFVLVQLLSVMRERFNASANTYTRPLIAALENWLAAVAQSGREPDELESHDVSESGALADAVHELFRHVDDGKEIECRVIHASEPMRVGFTHIDRIVLAAEPDEIDDDESQDDSQFEQTVLMALVVNRCETGSAPSVGPDSELTHEGQLAFQAALQKLAQTQGMSQHLLGGLENFRLGLRCGMQLALRADLIRNTGTVSATIELSAFEWLIDVAHDRYDVLKPRWWQLPFWDVRQWPARHRTHALLALWDRALAGPQGGIDDEAAHLQRRRRTEVLSMRLLRELAALLKLWRTKGSPVKPDRFAGGLTLQSYCGNPDCANCLAVVDYEPVD